MKVISINTSKKKGVPKTPVEKAEFKADFGIVGDAHGGPGIRQVSLLSKESIDEFSKSPKLKVHLKHGIFGENLITEGINLEKLKIGDRIKINNVTLEISKIGKECHNPCFIGRTVGDCIMPKEGIFGMVIKGGEVSVGDKIVLR